MLSHDANNDDAGMMIKRSQRALQIEMPTLFFQAYPPVYLYLIFEFFSIQFISQVVVNLIFIKAVEGLGTYNIKTALD